MTPSDNSSSAKSGITSTANSVDEEPKSPTKKSKVQNKIKSKANETESVSSSKTAKKSNTSPVSNGAPATPTAQKKVSVARTKSGSAAASELPPKSPMKRAKSSSASAQTGKKSSPTLVKPSSFKVEKSADSTLVPPKPQSMTNLGDRKQPARKKSPKITPQTAPISSMNSPISPVARRASSGDSDTMSTARRKAQEKLTSQESADASKFAAKRASMPNVTSPMSASPSKTRASVRQQMALQENQIASKGAIPSAESTPISLQKPPPTTEPGAYRVQGATVTARPSGVLSPQNNDTTPPTSPTRRSHFITTSPVPRALLPEQAPSPVSVTTPDSVSREVQIPKSARKKLVVAAELSEDLEAHIEEQVRQRIMSEAAKAQVVSVAHGIPMLDPKEEARRLADLREFHKPRGVREKLFGDSRNTDIDIATSPESIRKRNYLKWTVKRNHATSLWVATVQTKQKAVEQHDVIEVERTSVSFSATTQQEAFETGLAHAVPIMQPTEEHPICYVCKAKFALFRRPQHCKNCGVCICSNCTTQWPGKMFPETHNAKTLNNVCAACDWLANSFRDALVEGNYRTALHLYATGNVNIRTPFCLDKKAEVMHPIHLATLGGNVKLVRWLIKERFCPITVPRRTARGKKSQQAVPITSPLLTSAGRSPLAIAMLHQKLDLVRFLVVEAGASLFDEKDINSNLALANFTTLLKMLPETFFDGKLVEPTSVPQPDPRMRFGTDVSHSGIRRPSM